MSKVREELEKMLRNFLVVRWPRNISPMPDCFLLTQTILDAGYRRVEDMEIDEDEIIEILSNKLSTTQCEIIADGIKEHGHIGRYGRRFIAKAISQAKGIIKVKEAKND